MKKYSEIFEIGLIVSLFALAGAAVVFFSSGCASLSPGADPFVVRVEQTETTAKSTFDLVLNLDNVNRGFWITNAPAFHTYCEWLRQPITIDITNSLPRASAMVWQLDEVKQAYKASKTQSNTLYSVWAVVDSALTQASAWSTIVTNQPKTLTN